MEIYEKDWRYSFLRPYVDAVTAASYSSLEIAGAENVPSEGAVILAPNHCNALMDALVILRSRKGPTVFGARADIFKKETNAKALKFLRILPLVRRRDGLRNVSKNKETIGRIVEVLDHNVPFCLFPEGTHRCMHSLLPIGKTPLRLALAAIENCDPSKPVYILPVSLEYGDYFRYRSTCLMTFSKPIDVRSELSRFSPETHNESEIYKHFSDLISDALKANLTYLPDDGKYDGRWALVKALRASSGGNPEERLRKNQQCIDRMLAREKEHPEKMDRLYEKALEFEKARKKAKISINSFGKDLVKKLITKTVAGAFLLPIFIAAAFLVWPMLAASIFVKKSFKDEAFRNTGCMVVNLALTPLMTLIWGIVFFCFQPWYYAIVQTVFTVFSYTLFFEIKEFFRIYISDWRLMFNSSLTKMYSKLVN